ncbi:bleomycin resistance protein [Aureimonas leprariae]|uniref:Bleomycin resistance protein n=1 Tax=Plantimonas leprariae TaxID=2615207 RepID=A0A7V7U0T4_9HYPH|nr:VOC family protein [Aureimonas leprariae]KAB0680889.1 VOC family protein [Aureimonas leprariae]
MANALIPELAVTDWRRSLAFYRDVIGFTVRYLREDEGFAFLELGPAELMIDQIGLGRDFDADGRLRPPLGAGLNLQLAVPDVDAVYRRVVAAGATLVLEIEERWYRWSDEEVGQRQFAVADPDGYVIRPMQALGARPCVT